MEVTQFAAKIARLNPLLRWLGGGMLRDHATSAFTSEDLYSNLLGIKAGTAMRVSALGGRAFPLADRLAQDFQDSRSVDPKNTVYGNLTAKYWLILGAEDSKKMSFLPVPGKMRYHRCVCDEKDEPIDLKGTGEW